MARRMIWHVPKFTWHKGSPAAGSGVNNVGRDIAVSLVSTNPATQNAVPDDAGDWVVKRIIGQYLISMTQALAENYLLHSRIYPVTADDATVALRDLDDDDDAESDFLWHKVEPWALAYNGDLWGNWQLGGNQLPASPFTGGRLGHIDVNVNRKITSGNDLIWHSYFAGGNAPVDDEADLFLWLRMLLVEA